TNRDLKLAHCANLACSTATATTVDAFDDVGARSSVATGSDGLPLISYIGPGPNGPVLRVVHCGHSDCTAVIVAPFSAGRSCPRVDADDDVPDLAPRVHVPVRLDDLLERVAPVDERPERAGLDQPVEVGQQLRPAPPRGGEHDLSGARPRGGPRR